MDAPSQPAPSPSPIEPPWASVRDEELLAMRICDLGVRIEGSELEPRIAQLLRRARARAACRCGRRATSATSGSRPSEQPAIAVPVLPGAPAPQGARAAADAGGRGRHARVVRAASAARVRARRRSRVSLLAASSLAAALRQPRQRLRARASTGRGPTRKSFVRHLPNWYAQAHPDEDFAETFAVWLGAPEREWRARYRGWKALEKLEYVRRADARGGGRPGRRQRGAGAAHRRREPDAHDAGALLRRAAQALGGGLSGLLRRRPARHLRAATPSDETAARFHAHGAQDDRARRSCAGPAQRKYMVDDLARKLMHALRAARAARAAGRGRASTLDCRRYVASLVTNHLHTGRFKRSV